QRDPFSLLDTGHETIDDTVAAERDGEIVKSEGRHARLLLVRSTTAKNGAPKKAVTTPIGSSAGDITVRASTSAKTRKPAPTTTTNAIRPLPAAPAAVAIVAATTAKRRTRATFTPRPAASSSPTARTSRSRRCPSRISQAAAAYGAMMPTSRQPDVARRPSSH